MKRILSFECLLALALKNNNSVSFDAIHNAIKEIQKKCPNIQIDTSSMDIYMCLCYYSKVFRKDSENKCFSRGIAADEYYNSTYIQDEFLWDIGEYQRTFIENLFKRTCNHQ